MGSVNCFADPIIFSELKIPAAFLKAYQYKNLNPEKNLSPIYAKEFYFSNQGQSNPRLEFEAAYRAYQNDQPIYGIQKTFAACAFPARKKIIEKYLGIKFPDRDCKDLDEWVKQINADRVAIVFAGSYRGSPASIMGHTFLRFYHNDERGGNPLLSYAVGFLAHPPSGDPSLLYMWRGLSGQYFGGYEIEPFYQKVGLYNNSESRDIWEYELALTPEEVELLVKYIWELTFNSKIPYYFLDENCSYRLIQALDFVRPNLNMSEQFHHIVLPAETVRLLKDKKLVQGDVKYRSSIQTRLDYKVSLMTSKQKILYYKAQSDNAIISTLNDELILDTLIDYWNIKNYKALAQLSIDEQLLMNQTLNQRAQVNNINLILDENSIRKNGDFNPPFLGHKVSRLNVLVGSLDKNFAAQMSYRSGVHSDLSHPMGYEQIAAIEYLGFDLKLNNKNEKFHRDEFNWRLVVIEALSLENITASSFRPSWGADVSLGNDCVQCGEQVTDINLTAKVGLSEKIASLQFYGFTQINERAWYLSDIDHQLMYGIQFGFLYASKKNSFKVENQKLWSSKNIYDQFQLTNLFHLNINESVVFKYTIDQLDHKIDSKLQDVSVMLGYQSHF